MSHNKPRVFVTQESSQLNYSHAEEFGEVVFLTRDEVSPVPGSLVNASILTELHNRLADFDFDNDFLAPSGSPVVSGLAFMVLGVKAAILQARPARAGFPDHGPSKLCVLRWSNRDRVYQPISITLT